MMLNALTIDVEEHFQVHNFANVVERSEWPNQPSRVVESVRRILRLLAEERVQATFFILGWVADRHPCIAEEIADAGHELGTHGYWHELVYRQTPAEFGEDLARSMAAIRRPFESRAKDVPPLSGYRAPAFSITGKSLWALDVLREQGIAYDSSIFPIAGHHRYGIGTASRFANRMDSGLWEFPVSTVELGRWNCPVAGGGYFRLLPLWMTRRAIRRINREGHPAVVYLHPWEFDPDQPRIGNAAPLARFRHYVNLDKTEQRMRTLLREFRFASMRDTFADRLQSA